MASQVIPTPWPVVHVARTLNLDVLDAHGNPTWVVSDPVVRKVQGIAQLGRYGGSSRLLMDDEHLDTTTAIFHVSVPDPTVYKQSDQVILFPELDDDGNWIGGTGTAYFVDGVPADDRTGPWSRYGRVLGGTLRLRRIG